MPNLAHDLVLRALPRIVTEATANQLTDHAGLHLAHAILWVKATPGLPPATRSTPVTRTAAKANPGTGAQAVLGSLPHKGWRCIEWKPVARIIA